MKPSSTANGNLLLRRLLLAGYAAAVLGATLAPLSSDAYEVVSGLDKLAHVVLFGGVAVLLCWNLDSISRRKATLVFLSTTAFAAAIELVQGELKYRSGDFWDLLAGALGALLGVAAVWFVTKVRYQLGTEPD